MEKKNVKKKNRREIRNLEVLEFFLCCGRKSYFCYRVTFTFIVTFNKKFLQLQNARISSKSNYSEFFVLLFVKKVEIHSR